MEVNGICEHNDQTSYLSSTEPNWSSADVDAHYTWCWECSGVCTCTMVVDTVHSDADKDGEECESYCSQSNMGNGGD